MFWLKMHLTFVILSGLWTMKTNFFNIFNDHIQNTFFLKNYVIVVEYSKQT